MVASFALSGCGHNSGTGSGVCHVAVAHQSVVTVSANVTDTSGISDKKKALGEAAPGRERVEQ